MLSLGTDLALVWAVLGFVMNFVPSVGIILSVVPPALLTLLEFGWVRALIIVLGFLVLNFLIDNVIKPRFMQSGLDVSPLVGLLSLVVWSFLLGPTGALLALPLTIALKRVFEEPPPQPVAALPPPPPPAEPPPAEVAPA
jgi:predicted PurR-regulated permease PerM